MKEKILATFQPNEYAPKESKFEKILGCKTLWCFEWDNDICKSIKNALLTEPNFPARFILFKSDDYIEIDKIKWYRKVEENKFDNLEDCLKVESKYKEYLVPDIKEDKIIIDFQFASITKKETEGDWNFRFPDIKPYKISLGLPDQEFTKIAKLRMMNNCKTLIDNCADTNMYSRVCMISFVLYFLPHFFAGEKKLEWMTYFIKDGEYNFFGNSEVCERLNERYGGWTGDTKNQESSFWGGNPLNKEKEEDIIKFTSCKINQNKEFEKDEANEKQPKKFMEAIKSIFEKR